jgi:hypothetical protein
MKRYLGEWERLAFSEHIHKLPASYSIDVLQESSLTGGTLEADKRETAINSISFRQKLIFLGAKQNELQASSK